MGHVNVNFPLLHKCCDKSGAASHKTLIAIKSFDVLSANQSKQITVSPSVQRSSSKIHPTFWLQDKCTKSPPAWEGKLVIIFQNAPVRQAFCVLHTLYSSERDELDVYTASSPNDFLVWKEFRKCSLSVAVVFTQISRSLQPEIMTKTKELHRPDNEAAVKINIWRPHSVTRHSLSHTDNKKAGWGQTQCQLPGLQISW